MKRPAIPSICRGIGGASRTPRLVGPTFCLLALILGASAPSQDAAPAVGSKHLPAANRKLVNVTFVAFDTETTGLSPKNDRIVEVAAVKYRNGEIVEEKSWLVNPQRSIPYFVQRVHGITPAMVKDSPVFREIYGEFLDFIGDSVLIAHNAPFDVSFIKNEAIRCSNAPPPNKVVDSLALFRKWYPELKSHSLASLAEHVQVSGDAFHRALADSVYLARLFDKSLVKLGDDARLSDLYAVAGGPLKF